MDRIERMNRMNTKFREEGILLASNPVYPAPSCLKLSTPIMLRIELAFRVELIIRYGLIQMQFNHGISPEYTERDAKANAESSAKYAKKMRVQRNTKCDSTASNFRLKL